MDKSWIDDNARHTKTYLQGVNSFLAFAFSNSAVGSKILCPCRKCVNSFWKEASEVREHLICDGFLKGYRTWNLHGEASSSSTAAAAEVIEESSEDDELSDLLRDLAAGLDDRGDFEDNSSTLETCPELVALQKLVAENSKELFPNCKKYTQLRFLIRLLHIKLLGGWTDRSMNLLLDLLNDAFPGGPSLPKNFHEAKKLVKSIGVGYNSIHACENDCVLFWKENVDLNSCPKCKVSRWKSDRKSLDGRYVYKVPKKVLRYFPIKKSLQRLFLSSKTASLTRWHDEDRKKDGLLRHPADSPLWQDFDERHPEFSADSQNIRLAFATDGFNPFRMNNVSYSVWPGICIPLNLPPSMCMKPSNFILSLLIPGKYGPGSDMDVFLQPLIYDLLDMFENGVRTYDASRGGFFKLRAAVLWTISDFPGLGYVSGSTTSGEAGCPDCHQFTCSLRLRNGTKTCYMDHHRFLDENHPFMFDADKFGGKTEFRPAPTPLSGEQILDCTKDLSTSFGKDPSRKQPTRKKRKEGEPLVIFKRRSIWFKLPYWKDLMLRHNFDVMHIGKNVCESLINTFLGTAEKSKDNLNSRLDLQALGIRSDLHPVEVGDQFYLPPAPYTMSPDEKKLFCRILKGVKFPDGYASNIRHNIHVNEKKIFGLKSHECHIILQHLLPLAVRKILPVGSRSRELASVIGCLVRKISVRCSDWRLVDVNKKSSLWNDIKAKYDIPADGKNWVLKTAGIKWKDFKALLKKQYFDDKLTDEELKKMYGDRVNESDWQYLVTHWMSPEFEARAEIAKANRAKLAIHHTSGTKSFARCRHELGHELGRPPRRDEVYIKTHTRKNGVPTQNAEPIINKLQEIVEARPELKERTIEQGDALAAACGAQEPRGRVRTLGLGPTPQDIGIAGLKCFPSTRFQMEVFTRKKAEQRIAELEEQFIRQEERHAEERQNFMEVMSHNGSNSRHHVSPRSTENVYDAHHHDAHFQEDEDYGDNEDHEACPEEGEYLFARRRPAALAMQGHQRCPNSTAHTVHGTSPHQRTPNDTAPVVQHHAPLSCCHFSNNATPIVEDGAAHEVQPNAIPTVPNNVLPAVQHDAAQEVQPDAAQGAKPVHPEAGMNVILYEVVRSDARVALGTIISTNPKTIIGGVALGKQYCEVVMNHVLKRDATLPRTYPGVEKMADAYKLSITWPYNRVKQQASKSVRKGSKLPLGVSAGGEKSSGLAAGREKS